MTAHCTTLFARSLFVSSVWMAATAVNAATFTVTRTDDPVPGACVAGDCSLREAILDANAAAAPGLRHVIQLPRAAYRMTRGTLTVETRVLISGGTTAVQHANPPQASGVYLPLGDFSSIEGTQGETVMEAIGEGSIYAISLGLFARGANALTLRAANDNVLANFVSEPSTGGAVFAVGSSSGPFTSRLRIIGGYVRAYVDCGRVESCELIDVTLLRLQVGSLPAEATDVILDNTRVTGALDADAGSGVVLQTTGSVSIIDSAIEETNIGLAVLDATPSIEFTRSRYVENSQPLRITGDSTLVVADSEFRDNVSDDINGRPGALQVSHPDASLTVRRSTFVGNRGNGDVGGAVLISNGATALIENSTFSNNSFTVEAAGQGARGGAIGFREDPTVTSLVLRHVTMVAPIIGVVGVTGSTLGGVGGTVGLRVDLHNNIFRGSCRIDADNVIDSSSGNIESAGDTCRLDADNQVNVPVSALALGPLGNFGGRTQTHQPSAISAAVDSGNPAISLSTDQRNYRRPFGTGPDVGAVERTNEIFRDGFE